MESEYKSEQARQVAEPLIILVVILVTLLVLTICALVGSYLTSRKADRQPPIQILPATAEPTAMPAHQFSVFLPIISSSATSQAVAPTAPGDIWEVINFKKLGYELAGQRYDLATFRRVDSQDTVKAYCINRGWARPEIGAKYLLNEQGIFVPLYEPQPDTIQRFLMIR